MLKNFKKFIEVIVNSNLWIALAAVAFYQTNLLQIHRHLELNATVFFLFFSTLFVYNLFRILNLKDDNKNWYSKNHLYTKLLILFSFVGIVISFFFLDSQYLYIFALSGILSFLYISPFFKIDNFSFNFRNFWFLKSVIVALVWVLTTSVLPLLENDIEFSKIITFSIEKFLFILGITIPYDIKDLKEDKKYGLNTFALKFGIKKTIIFSNLILSIAFVLAIFTHKNFLLSSILIYTIVMLLNLKTDENNKDLWYTFIIDGTIILYFLFALFF